MTSYNGKNGIEQSIIDHSSQVDFSTTMIVVFAYLCTLTLWYYCLCSSSCVLFITIILAIIYYYYEYKILFPIESSDSRRRDLSFPFKKRGYEFKDTQVLPVCTDRKIFFLESFFSQFFREINFTKKITHFGKRCSFFIVLCLSLCMVMAKA